MERCHGLRAWGDSYWYSFVVIASSSVIGVMSNKRVPVKTPILDNSAFR